MARAPVSTPAAEPPSSTAATLRLTEARPHASLSVRDGVAIVVGIVIGSAVFETPALVAANAGSAGNVILLWLAGGAISIVGALCYAELAATYPHAGGDYHYLSRAWGGGVGFLFAWGRMSVIQTGSIALIAFVFGDYASQVYRLGPWSSAVWAAVAVSALTLLHLAGLNLSRRGQLWLTGAQLGGLLLLIIAGYFFAPNNEAALTAAEPISAGSLGLAMVFVLLTYGGWNEAAFVSAELRQPRKNVVRVLMLSVAIIASFYVLLNAVMLQSLGLSGMAASEAVGADLMRIAAGERGAVLVSLLVMACALASINAMIFTGARTSWAIGRDFPLLSFLGRWRSAGSVPINALLLQSAVVLLLIGFGAMRRSGFESMVDYTAPVFWMFFFLTTISLIRLRSRSHGEPRGYSVPLYPLTPVVFAAVCAYLFYSSVMYTGIGSLLGLAVVGVGIPVYLLARRRSTAGM